MAQLKQTLQAVTNTALKIIQQRRANAQANGESFRFDGLENPITGFGMANVDKTVHSSYRFGRFLTDPEISALYHENPMAAVIVDIWPEEMLRPGYVTELGDMTATEWIAEKHRGLNVTAALMDAMRWGRAFGGGVVLIGADDGRPASQPLRIERCRALRYLYAIDRRYLQPLTYYSEPGSKKMGLPETYRVTPLTAHGTAISQVVHESRLLVFGGAPTGAEEKQRLGGWDYSVLQRPYEALIQFETAYKAIGLMLTDNNQAVYRMNGLDQAIASGEGEYLKARMQAIELGRSMMRALIINAGGEGEQPETFERQAISFTDIPATLEKIMVRLSGASRIPVSKLFGTTPTGMNASGDADFRNFYDRIEAAQKQDLAPKVRYLNEILLGSLDSPYRGKTFEKHLIQFGPLYTLDPLGESQRRQADATADSAYVSAGVYLPEEIALQRSMDGSFPLSPDSIEARKVAMQAGLEDIEDPYEEVETPPIETPEVDNGLPTEA